MALTAEQVTALEQVQAQIAEFQTAISVYEANIQQAEENNVNARSNIAFAESQITDEALPDDLRQQYEDTIVNNLEIIAFNESTIRQNQASIITAENQIAADQQIVSTITETATSTKSAGAVPAASEGQGTTTPTPVTPGEINRGPAAVPPSQTGYVGVPYDDDGNLMPGYSLDENNNPVYVGGDFVEPATADSAAASRNAASSRQAAQQATAKQQQTLMSRENTVSSADWRVKISLAQGSDYLYNTPANVGGPGILAPLSDTQGVIFPYTPSIEMSYQAKYDMTDLVHSNYRGYFYKNSTVSDIQIRGTFTAQDTKEAQYLLAVIHFFRSVTKMFYGKDDQRGTPPPLVYLSAYGQYQFNNHPCVVSSFTYSLPTDVDYIRAEGFNNYGINLENRRNLSSGPAPSGALATIGRLLNSGLFNGSEPNRPSPGAVNQLINNTNATNSTYVPTKMDISLTLSPIQTRSQVSKQFSLKSFANGDQLKGGFW